MFFLGAALIAAGCGGDDGSTGASHLGGRVDEPQTARAPAVAGIHVEASAVAGDGSLTALGEATVGADGRYAIDVDVPASAVAVELRTDEATARAVVVSVAQIAAAGTATLIVPPINTSASLTADVYIEAHASGHGSLDLERLNLVMSPTLMAKLSAGANHDATVTAAADAAIQAQVAWTAALAIDGGGDASAAAAAMVRAETALAVALDTARSTIQITAAYAAYVQASLDAHVAAGYHGAQLALAAEASAQAMVNGTLPSTGTSSAQFAALIAGATTASVDSNVGVIATGDWSAVTSAGATLRTSAAGATTDAAAIQAFATYQTFVVATIATRAQVGAVAMAALGVDIDGSASTLTTQLHGAASASAIITALTTYHAAVASSAHVTVLTTAGATPAGAGAALQVLGDVEAATR